MPDTIESKDRVAKGDQERECGVRLSSSSGVSHKARKERTMKELGPLSPKELKSRWEMKRYLLWQIIPGTLERTA